MRVAYVFDTIGFYLQQGLAPWWGESLPLHPADSDAVLSPSRLPRIAAGVALAAAVLVGVARRYYSGWMVACALACLLPVLNIVILPLAGNIGFDRFLTLPLVFVALAIAGVDLSRSKVHAIATNLVLTIALAFWAFSAFINIRATVPRWANDIALWSWLHQKPSTSASAEWNLVAAAMRLGRYDIVLDVSKQRLEEEPLEAEQQAVYGLALAHCGDPKEGMAYIRGAMLAYPPTSYAPANWREERGAIALYRDRLGYAHYAMAEALILAGMIHEALEAAEEAVKYRPEMLEALVLRSVLRKVAGQPDPDTLNLQSGLERAYPAERQRLVRKGQMMALGVHDSCDASHTGKAHR
jgi:tetratricopeptide (TPR) repeat protein